MWHWTVCLSLQLLLFLLVFTRCSERTQSVKVIIYFLRVNLFFIKWIVWLEAIYLEILFISLSFWTKIFNTKSLNKLEFIFYALLHPFINRMAVIPKPCVNTSLFHLAMFCCPRINQVSIWQSLMHRECNWHLLLGSCLIISG